MGYVRTRQGKKGKSYQAHWTDDLGREQMKSFTRKTDAVDHIKVMEAAKVRGDYIDTASKVTVADYARQWAATRPHRSTTAVRIKSLIDVHIDGTQLGAQRLATVRPSQVQGWIADRSRVLSPSTLRLLVQLIRSIFAAATADRLIGSNPVPARVSLPRSEKPRIVPLTVEQVQALADAVPPRCRAMIITQAGLGLRVAELLALSKQNISSKFGTVRIEWQLTQDGKDRVDPKTPRSRRTLPLPSVVAEALAAHIAEFPPDEDGSLFTTELGNRYRQEHYQARHFAPAVRAARLPAGTTSHDLRHHFASVMLQATGNPMLVSEMLGHENATLVLKVYGHLMPGSEDQMRRVIDAAWTEGRGAALKKILLGRDLGAMILRVTQ